MATTKKHNISGLHGGRKPFSISPPHFLSSPRCLFQRHKYVVKIHNFYLRFTKQIEPKNDGRQAIKDAGVCEELESIIHE